MNEEQARLTALREGVVQGQYDLTGSIDLHVHTAPCIFPRLGDDIQVATGMRDSGVRAFAIKSHHESTVGRAHLARVATPGIDVIGGITLNWPVGGVNPAAVEAALMTGGRVVWGPSGHSAYHGSITGKVGNWGIKGMVLPTRGDVGVTFIDETGELTDDARNVLELVEQFDGLFATSHLSPEEILAVLRFAKTIGLRVLVNHVIYFPRGGEDLIREIVGLGGYIEFISALVIPTVTHGAIDYRYERIAAIMADSGYDRCVISSDAGGVFMGLWPHEQLRMFAQGLIGAGIDEADVRRMMTETPARIATIRD
jgi:hypothetical protein